MSHHQKIIIDGSAELGPKLVGIVVVKQADPTVRLAGCEPHDTIFLHGLIELFVLDDVKPPHIALG